MAKEVTIYEKVEAAIITSFDYLKVKKLPRKRIIEKAHELSGESEANIGKRIDKLKEKNYLIRHERYEDKDDEKKRRWGVYSVNPEFRFEFQCEPLPSDATSAEIPLERREAHTLDLRGAIENWIDNFPTTPHIERFDNFFEVYSDIEICERHLLFSDLSNHLPVSGFNVLDNWEKYKKDVKELRAMEGDILKMIEQNVSSIFEGLPLRFIKESHYLGDYQCTIPQMIFVDTISDIAYGIIYSNKLRNARTKEEADEIHFNFGFVPYATIISNMQFIEEGDSIIWGNSELQCMRIPKKDKDILMRAKDQAIAFINCPSDITKEMHKKIDDKLKQLQQEREDTLNELKRSLYCQCFSGDCRYLRGSSG